MAQVDETVEQLNSELEALRTRVATLQEREAQSKEAEERTRAEWEAHKQAGHLQSIFRMTGTAVRAATLEDIYEEALTSLQHGLHVDRAAILLIDPDGVMRFKAWRGLSDPYRAATEGHSPWSPDDQNPQAVLVHDINEDESLAHLRDVVVNEGIRSLAFIPLVYSGRLLGKFMVYCETPRCLSPEEVQLSETLAGHIAFAIVRKRNEDEKARLLVQVQRQRERLDTVISNVPGIVWEAWGKPDEATQRIDFVSAYVEKMLGYSVEEWLATPNFWLTIVHPDDREEAMRVAVDLFASGESGTNRFRWLAKDGRVLWVESRSATIRNEQGEPAGMVGVTLDVTERKEAEEERTRLLAEEQKARAEAEEAHGTLAAVAEVLDRALAESELLNSISNAAAGEADLDRMLLAVLEHLRRVIPFTGGSIALVEGDELAVVAASGPFADAALGTRLSRGAWRTWRVVDTGEPFISGDLAADGLTPTSPMRSYLAVPLAWRGMSFGILEIDSTEPGRFTQGDLSLMVKVAAALSGPIELARRYAVEVRAVAEAESARHRLALLSEASSVLAGTLDYRVSLQSLARLVVPHLSDTCLIDIVNEEKQPERVAAVNMDPVKEALMNRTFERFPPAANGLDPAAKSIRSGQPVVVNSISDQFMQEMARHPEHLAFTREMGYTAIMSVPLLARGRTLGAITFASSQPGCNYGPEDVALAEELARRAATAIENARLYHASQEATALEQQRANQLLGLARASLAINSPLSVADVLQAITDQAREIVGAHQALISMTHDQNWSQSISAVSLSDKYEDWSNYTEQPNGTGIYSMVCETNRPTRMTQAEVEAHPRWRGFGTAHGKHPPLRGWLAAPLIGRDGNNLGLIQLSDKYEGEFTEQDEAILVQLAHMASIAVDNARLYAEAHEAVRAREELISIVSHDLRSPLGAIKGFAQLLRKRVGRLNLQESETRPISEGLGRIEGSASKINALINELMDYARLQVGEPIELDRHLVELVALIRQTIAEHQGTPLHQITFEPRVGSLGGWWDAGRLERVMSNLLSNAVKYSPNGGPVTVTLDKEEGPADHGTIPWAVIKVEDHGLGIPAADLPRIFERFRRAGNVTGRIRGSGIGLASVRQIVEQHGGTVSVESEEGVGSTFTVRLPVARDVAPSEGDLK